MFVRCWHMSLSSLSCHFTRVLVTSQDHTLRFLIFTVINPVNCERTVISLFHLFSRSDDHRCGPRWGLLTTECIVRDGVYTCTLGVQAVCTVYSQHGMWRTHCTESGECHMETRILITQHVEKNIFPRDILELICVLFSYRLVASHIGNGTQRVAHWSLTCHEDIIGACQEMVRVSQPLIVSPSPRVTSADLSPPQCHHSRPPLLTCLQYWLAMECGPLTRNVLA